MAGVSIKVKVDDRKVVQAITRLLKVTNDLTPAWRDIGEYLLNAHRQRISLQQDPDGNPWTPLSEQYQKRKKKNKDKMLVLEGDLFRQFSYEVSPNQLEFMNNTIQAATHQFGDPSRNIPARPFMGLSEDDNTRIMNIVNSHIKRAAR